MNNILNHLNIYSTKNCRTTNEPTFKADKKTFSDHEMACYEIVYEEIHKRVSCSDAEQQHIIFSDELSLKHAIGANVNLKISLVNPSEEYLHFLDNHLCGLVYI